MRYLNTLRISVIVFSFLFCGTHLKAQEETLTIESYYKIKWSYAAEFISLWKKNHYPLMKKAQEKGDILSITAEKPILHSGEDTRWDFKVTIVYKNAANGLDHGITDQYKKQLYPDLEKLAKEEKHRFELVLAHWDFMTEKIDLTK
ncbi:MAG TPA: hypothetical protein VNA26_09035 [Chitinophagaceae bacterium]|nr:hypothetical protein [Chitinophagaceae bacterium]